MNLTITLATTPAVLPNYFNIYRSDNGGPFTLIARIPVAQGQRVGGGSTTWSDRNIVVANTNFAFVGELSPDVLEFRQLLPLIKMDLAVISPAYRWMLLLYGTPVMYAPRKWVKIINIGDAT